ncbi:MAG: HPr family phosphocarrier protein [Mycoplasma sp.]|nr:HPr family phosphocarrier protein [Mycoplasma sp.]
MKKIVSKVIDPIGLHARPASILVSVASEFESDVKLLHEGKEANAKSIMNIMALGVSTGTEITLVIEGSDENAAHEKITATLIENGFISEPKK